MFDKLVNRQLEATLKTGGSTFGLSGTDYAKRGLGYAVSISPERGRVIDGKLDRVNLKYYWRSVLSKFHTRDFIVGTWYDERENRTYLDLVEVVDSKEDAVTLGRLNNQKAVWDFEKEEEIFLDGG